MEGSSEGLRGEVGSSFQVVGNAWVLGRIWAGLGRVLGASWAAPGHLGQLLGSSWAVLGGSWPLLGRLWRSWEALGQLLDALGQLLGAPALLLGGSGSLLGANLEPRWTLRGTKSTPRPSKIEAKTVQNDVNI